MYRDVWSKQNVLPVAREGFDLLAEMLLQIFDPKNYSLTVEVGHCHLSPFANERNYVDFNGDEFLSEESAVYLCFVWKCCFFP